MLETADGRSARARRRQTRQAPKRVTGERGAVDADLAVTQSSVGDSSRVLSSYRQVVTRTPCSDACARSSLSLLPPFIRRKTPVRDGCLVLSDSSSFQNSENTFCDTFKEIAIVLYD